MAQALTLAITTIGDLLLNNAISTKDDGSRMEDIHLAIPEYQRPYKWTAKNVNQLFDDIATARGENKERYRVGTLILHRNVQEGSVTYDIVDGQQRTITFSLLLKALDDSASIRFLEQSLAGNHHNLHNVVNNFRTLSRRVDQMKERIEEFSEYVQKNCELIVVITDDLSEAFQFFDSQNARGKKLYPHDLLKAYHLREMSGVDVAETEKTVRIWEDMDQQELATLFNEYLYRVKEWIKGNRADELTEQNIDVFKGITARDNFPYAQFYKGAFAYADQVNNSHLPFVTGVRQLSPFQLNAPIVAGKPFFAFSKHYFDILQDIRNNDKYEGYFINDNDIVKTLNLRAYTNGVGNRVTRLLFNTAILLYVDRFCPSVPTQNDLELLDHFTILAFIWAYSLRAQYYNVGWLVAQNYVMGTSAKEVLNSFNLYKMIAAADSPITLQSELTGKLVPLPDHRIVAKKDNINAVEEGVHQNYLYFFDKYKFRTVKK